MPEITALTHHPLLVELLTEELPPKALLRLGEAFAATIAQGLEQQGLSSPDAQVDVFATPRRLAVRVNAVRERADARAVEIKGPSVAVGLDPEGQPTLALRKWADKQGTTPEALTRASDGKQECFYLRTTVAGATLADAIPALDRCARDAGLADQ
jgi:glycyl-tRNA synthetase beta chain